MGKNEQKSPKADDPEMQDWRESISSVIAYEGTERADDILEEVVERARASGAAIPFAWSTAYINTISVKDEARIPGDRDLEHRIAAAIRWNAAAMVLRANKESTELGGHIASYQSAAILYETGFNHFWHAPSEEHGGDLVLIQGHSSPGIYARAFLEGRLTEDQLLQFRQEVGGRGLSSYPHPWLMPDFWQFPTVSMGLGPLMAIYQARFLKYLHARGLANTENRKVWVFCGDGEMDEPETKGAITPATREKKKNKAPSSSSTATFNALMVRFAATARLSRNSNATFAALGGMSSKSSGARNGTSFSHAIRRVNSAT